MPTISYGDVRACLEGLDFQGRVSIASTPEGFFTMLSRQPEFLSLIDILKDDEEIKSTLLSRIDSLSNQEVDERYLNPFDTVLAAYVIALKQSDPQVGNIAAKLVERASNIHWCRYAAKLPLISLAPASESKMFASKVHANGFSSLSSNNAAKELLYTTHPSMKHGLSARVVSMVAVNSSNPQMTPKERKSKDFLLELEF